MRNLIFKVLFINIIIILSPAFSYGMFDGQGVENKQWTKKYDVYFKKYTKRYFGLGFDYLWFKSQAIAESNLKKDAKSWVGAKGIMQIMPKTFTEIQEKNPSFKHVYDPRWNIAAGIFYDKKMFEFWKAERPFLDKISFVFASYNAGARNVLKGQKLCENKWGKDCKFWNNVKEFAEKVKNWRSKETMDYIRNIFKLMKHRI